MVAIDVEADRHPVALPEQLMLPEELNRLVAGAVDADLRSAQESEAIFEADLRAAVGAETVREQIAEVALRRAVA